MDYTEYAAADATELARLIATGAVSKEEVWDTARTAMTAVNAELNCLADDPFEQPLSYDESGPFAGVPFAIKDLVCHAEGVRTRLGTALAGDGLVPEADTNLMARFRAAGLATMGVTTTPELGFNANTEALIYGSTRNPWDTTRSPGGSSGGSSALVAAGAIPVAHANDGGGSIRIPAACNGLVGLKPSRWRTSLGPDMNDALSGLAVEFAVTRSVRDAAALLDVVGVPFPGDRVIQQRPERPWRDEVGADPGRLRIGVHTASWGGTHVDPEVVAAVEATAKQLEAAGHHVEYATPVFDWDAFIAANVVVWCSFLTESVAGLEMMLGVTAGPDNLERTTWACVQQGRAYSALELGMANAQFNLVSRAVGEFFTGYDLLLTPTANTPAMELGYLDANADLSGTEWTERIFDVVSFTPLFNVTGSPAISVPLGQSSSGLPIGVQLVADMCQESRLIQVAAYLEEAMPWRDRRPPVHVSSLL